MEEYPEVLEKKTKKQLIEIVQDQELMLTNLSEVINKIKETQIQTEEEIKENFKKNSHYNEVFNNLAISKERIGIALDILTPIGDSISNKFDIIDNKEIIQLANNTLINELTRINIQQQEELKVSSNIRSL